jgi:hypothetical protein
MSDRAPGLGGQGEDNSPGLPSEWALPNAIRTLADALHDPTEAYAIFKQRPVPFSRWQKIKIRWYRWRGQMARAQYVMLEQIGKEYDD